MLGSECRNRRPAAHLPARASHTGIPRGLNRPWGAVAGDQARRFAQGGTTLLGSLLECSGHVCKSLTQAPPRSPLYLLGQFPCWSPILPK